MLILNKGAMREPIGGHQYPSHGVMFRGDNFDQLVKRLTEFRIMNGIALGEPEKEILFHYAQNWPFMVKSVPDIQTVDMGGSNFPAWRKWVQRIWQDPPKKILTPKEAKDRWTVCEKCQFNVASTLAETTESKEIERRVFLLRRGIPVPTNVRFCALHGWDLSVASFVEVPGTLSDKVKGKENPPGCWA